MEKIIRNIISNLHEKFGYEIFEIQRSCGLCSKWCAALRVRYGVEAVIFAKIEDRHSIDRMEILNEMYHLFKTGNINLVMVLFTDNDNFPQLNVQGDAVILNYEKLNILYFTNDCEECARRIYECLAYLKPQNKHERSIPKVTYLLISLNVIYYIISAFLSKYFDIDINVLIQLGAKYNEGIMRGEYYRLIACTFLHGGLLHIVLNMYALFIIGPLVEKIYGSLKYLVIYLISGMFSSILSFILSPNVSIGASGAIFGLLGACLIFAFKNKNRIGKAFLADIVSVIFINIILGLSVQNIDNFGHIGGLLGGMACSSILYKDKK